MHSLKVYTVPVSTRGLCLPQLIYHVETDVGAVVKIILNLHLQAELGLDKTFLSTERTFAFYHAAAHTFTGSGRFSSFSLTVLIIKAVETQLAVLVYFCLPLKACAPCYVFPGNIQPLNEVFGSL